MAEIVENEEKIFKHFLELSSKVRERMIGKMNAGERCRLTRCSKLCGAEVNSSKNHVNILDVSCSPQLMILRMKFVSRFRRNGFVLIFDERSGKKMKIYKNIRFQMIWEDELDESADILQCGIEEFKNRMRTFQNSIKQLRISKPYHLVRPDMLNTIGSGIENLKNLERLTLEGDFNISQILSKLPHPLKDLTLNLRRNRELSLENLEQVHQVRELLAWRDANFDNAQFSRLSAKMVDIPVGKLTERDILKFIRSWQNGTVGREIIHYRWDLKGSNFSIRKLLRLLRDINSEHENPYGCIEIKHFNKLGISAILVVHQHSLSFSTVLRRRWDV